MTKEEYEQFKAQGKRKWRGRLNDEEEREHDADYERLSPQQKGAYHRLCRQDEDDWYYREACGPIPF